MVRRTSSRVNISVSLGTIPDVADELTVSRDGDTLVIRIPITKATPSASGKTLVVASTRGNQKTGLQIDGNDLYLGVNAYVYAEPKTKA